MIDQPAESDMRRRAAWLLAMLAVVAVLFVVLMVTLLNSSTDSGGSTPGPDDALGPGSATHSPHPSHEASATHQPASSSAPATSTCPGRAPCVLQGDAGNAIAAINSYRTHNGATKVPATVSKAAQACALSNGGGSACSGGWAESQVDKLSGSAAVAKIAKLGRLVDPAMTSFEVGWAYAPASHSYYFAIIRKD